MSKNIPQKRICALTMARNDEFFLNKWIAYYGAQLGEENLYIYLDGEDQPIPAKAGRSHVEHRQRIQGQVVSAEKRRLSFLSDRAAELLQRYDLVIGVDADEFLAVDPKCGLSLADYLSRISIPVTVSGLGVDVGQHLMKEPALDGDKPFLMQRNYALLSSRYTKPSVIARPVRWGSGFHRVKGHNFRIDPNLYLFHFGSVDMTMIEQRLQDKDRVATGRTRHIKKRARTIHAITKCRILDGDRWLPIARRLQTCLRPVYSPNKPSMMGLKMVVKIPKRFRNLI